jgi:hypothetical protein
MFFTGVIDVSLTSRLQILGFTLSQKNNNKCNNYYCSTLFFTFRPYFKQIFMRSGNFYNQLTGKIAVLSLLLCFLGFRSTAQVTPTPATGGTGICGSTAASESGAAFTPLGSITITETNATDFPPNGTYTLVFDAPDGWVFSLTSPTVSPPSGDITSASVMAITPTQITISVTVPTDLALDVVTISGVQVQPLTPTSAAGYIFVSADGGPVNAITTGPAGMNFGDLSVLPLPTVDPTRDTAFCNGDVTPAINFTGSATTFNWQPYNTSFAPIGTGGTGNIPPDVAVNTGVNPDTVIVVVTPVGTGACTGYNDTFYVVVNPTPSLSSPTSATACEGQTFTYLSTSLTTGTTYKWERPADAYNAAASGTTSTISETLNNGTTAGFIVTYTDTLEANGCRSFENITVTVNPQPVGTVTPTPVAICSGDPVNYTITIDVPGTTIAWSRAADASNPSNSGSTGIISENLFNTASFSPLVITYVDTLKANGCVYTETFTTTVNPLPTLTTPNTASVCDSAEFHYVPTATTGSTTTFTWARASMGGIANPPMTGADSIVEYLDNVAGTPVTVTYTITMTANGCSDTAHLHVTVNPLPTLTSPLTASTCTNALFTYTATPSVSGTTLTWTRPAVTGITPSTNAGTGNISETLVNTTTAPITVRYIYTLTLAGGCPNTDTVTVTVNPNPALTSSHNPTPICDSTLFTYTPAGTTGATFNWYRRYVPGVVSLSVTGTGPISEYLDNSTYVPVQVAYVFTVTVGSCSAIDSIHLTVNPTPRLSTPKNDSACSGIPFTYSPLAGSSLITFAWSRASAGSISPTTGSGTNSISETLINSGSTPVTVVYTYTLSIAGGTTGSCTNTEKLNVKVNPFIAAPSITLKSESSLCAGTAFQNFGIAEGQPSGIKYAWSAKNATVNAVGSDRQYALVSFPTAGTSVVYINTSSSTTGCIGRDSVTVAVSGSTAQNPGVIFTNGQLIALQNDVDSYQWGYDDKNTLKPNVIAGEINQNYFISGGEIDSRYYWVKTVKNGCTQKSYRVKPTGIVEINTAEIALKLFPNPASQFVNVEISTTDYNNMKLEVFNMLGQQIGAESVSGSTSQIDVAALPVGAYIVDCVQNGVKVASARFVKN